MSIDKLTSNRERRAFEHRQSSVTRLAQQLELDATNTVLIGGAAFARHGLNTHVPKAHDYAEPFDVEGYVSRQKFVDLNKRVWGSDNYLLGYRVILEGRQYPVHGMFFPEMLQYDGHRSLPKDFDAALEASEVVGGLAVLPVHMLAKTKLQAGRVKDVAGIIKAHIIASAEHHAVAEDPVWLGYVGMAAEMARTGNMEANHARVWRGDMVVRVPGWLSHLVGVDFDHPAFAAVSRPA